MNTEIKTLSAETVKNIVNAIKGGTITKVTYTSAPSLTAQSKKAGGQDYESDLQTLSPRS